MLPTFVLKAQVFFIITAEIIDNVMLNTEDHF